MIATLPAIVVLHWIVLVSPGPNVLLVTQLAASGQRRPALYAGLGVSTVALLWATLAVFGVEAVFRAHPHARLSLQIAGGAYLLHLSRKLWRSPELRTEADWCRAVTPREAFRRGFTTNILNPKSALFFGSVFTTSLPVAPSRPLVLAVLALLSCNALAWHTLLAVAFSQPKVQRAYRRQAILLNRVGAACLAAFGLRLHWQVWRELDADHG